MLALPMLFRTTADTIPADIPYLFADPSKSKGWREKLGEKTKPRIGLVWSGNRAHSNDANRSIPLEKLKSIWGLPLEFHSLQKEYREKDHQFLPQTPVRDHHLELNDFSDTAALVEQMDLIVSVDTSVAHLAGAMGKKVWVLLPDVPDFRWLLEGSNSAWYPQFELFRKVRGQGWESTLQIVADLLKQHFQT
jgi:ADP-heptose:LPS heptosyltransferase